MAQVTYIDMDSYKRKPHFDYFKSLAYPYVGMTVNVDITDWLIKNKQSGRRFFLPFLYAVARAANAVPELRQRIEGDRIIEFDSCPVSYTLALPGDTYCFCRLDCNLPFSEFMAKGEADRQAAMQNRPLDDEDDPSLLYISCLPWVSYTALVQPVPQPADSNPRITWGKYFEQGGRTLIPVSLLGHHALVDGLHAARFYEQLDAALAEEF